MTSEQSVSEVPTHQGQVESSGNGAAGNGVAGNGANGNGANYEGQDMPHGMGQSKSSRRRRRKRKGKGPEDGPEANAATGESIPSLQASAGASGHSSAPSGGYAQANNAPQSNGFSGPSNGHQQQNGMGASSSGKRWKKKFRDRERQQRPAGENPGGAAHAGSGHGGQGHSMTASAAPQPQQGFSGGRPFRDSNSHQPGNGGGFKRKGGGGGGSKQQGRGPRSFVGPMDHSYRAVNGNFAETPPSTIEPHGNYGSGGHARRLSYQSDSQPIDYSQGRPVAIADDAPTKIYFFIDDLFFIAKIGETARKLGVKVAFIKNDKDSIAALTSHEDDDRPGLIVFDLNNANAKPMTLIPKLKAKLKKGTSIVGFLSHLQGDLKAKAVEAGCDTVMPRAAFSQNLPNLLRRYGIADDEEQNFNQ